MKIRKKYDILDVTLSQTIQIGLKNSRTKKTQICNIENFKLRKCDCSVISATLEHADNPSRF